MIPVVQTISSDVDGDCVRACVASIFELPIDSVPHFIMETARYKHWTWAVQAWLAPANLSFVCVKDVDVPKGYSILTVKSKKFPGAYHAVVALDGYPVHDPSPTMADLDWAKRNGCWYHVLTIVDPTKPVDASAVGFEAA